MKKAINQMMVTYYRAWKDITCNPEVNKTSMDKIPEGVDMVMVFTNGNETQAFWDALKDVYVPALHAKGIKVLYTLGVKQLVNYNYPNTEAGYAELAFYLYEDRLDFHGLDGFDVDVEQYYGAEDYQRVIGVFKALSQYVGPASGTDKLFVYDTNQAGLTPMLKKVYSLMDYFLHQTYGWGVEDQQNSYNGYKDMIPPEKYLVGFSFYEEHGLNYNDVSDPIEQSKAWQLAEWQPTEGPKAGIFGYAVDRDGARYPDNSVIDTQYNDTKALLTVLKPE